MSAKSNQALCEAIIHEPLQGRLDRRVSDGIHTVDEFLSVGAMWD